jgi:carbonic anhydrase
MDRDKVSRRNFFRFLAATGVTTAVGLGAGQGGPRPARAADDTSTPDGALQALVSGNARFLAHNMTSFSEDLNLINSSIPESHQPFAAILSCADARLSPEIIFDQVMGDLFIVRVAGNIATPEMIASLEYAVAALGVRLILVLGHGACGAISAADRRTVVEKTQISALYAPLRVAVESAGPGANFDAKARLNATVQAALLLNASPLIAERVGASPQTLRVVPAYYNLIPSPPAGAPPNGQVDILPAYPLTPAAP